MLGELVNWEGAGEGISYALPSVTGNSERHRRPPLSASPYNKTHSAYFSPFSPVRSYRCGFTATGKALPGGKTHPSEPLMTC